jgi:hypothetical protein
MKTIRRGSKSRGPSRRACRFPAGIAPRAARGNNETDNLLGITRSTNPVKPLVVDDLHKEA